MDIEKNITHVSPSEKAAIVVGSAIVGVLSNSVQTSFFVMPERFFEFMTGTQFSIACTLITALGLFLMAILSLRSPRFTNAVPYLGLALTGAGLIALTLSPHFPIAIVAAALLIGFGVALGFGFWIVVTAGFGYKEAVLILAGFRCLSAIGAFGARTIGMFDIWIACLIILFIISIPLTIGFAKETIWKPAKQAGVSASFSFSSIKEIGYNLRDSILFVSVFGFASGALRAFSQAEHVAMFNTTILVGTFAGVALAIAIVTFTSKGFNLFSVRAAMLLCLATLYLAFPFVPENWWVVFFGFGDVLYVAASMYMNFTAVRVAKNKPLTALLVLGVSKGCLFLSVGLGFAGNNLLSAFFGRSTTGLLTLSLVSVYLIMLGVMPFIMKKTEKGATLVSMTEKQIRTNPILLKTFGLTEREMDVLVLTLGGSNAAAIAKQLYISENTVKTHSKRIYLKLGVHSKEELRLLVTNSFEKEE